MNNPAKSALDAARERLEAEYMSWASGAVAIRSHGPQHAKTADDCERNASDLRLVLDALKEAERKRDSYQMLSEGLEKLCVSYRTGRAPSEATFTKIEKARAALEAKEQQ